MLFKKTPLLLIIVIVCAIAAVLIWRELPPKTYQLLVINHSQLPVDYVRVFGTAVTAEQTIINLPAGQSDSVAVTVSPQGNLRFEVAQGMNRIDTYLSRDVSGLHQYQQRLTINAGNHFILSD